ncbi:MAG TPA: thymidine phosphorylase [Patescibacteria group bacterium]|nr:thymidine phosphorylase [Patescibacteria group bacterium]
MLPQEIIRKKRDGLELSAAEIREFITGVTAKNVSEGQVAAFCMATLLKGMKMPERVALTQSMAQSGTVMDWKGENLPGPILDKHSTGGIGDKVSLMLAPIIAACGGFVPMLSGRGLGHTGGTLDKMDAIPGYVSQPDTDLFRKTVRNAGCAIIGATPDLAPADRIIYSIRDVTGTVESIDLITASILSKKLAAGLDGLVMDVKFGTGAFMQRYDDAKALAESIVNVANGAGLPTVGLLTDMNQVLGRTAGNAVEVEEALEYLQNSNIDKRLHEVNVALTAELLVLGKLATDLQDARAKIEAVLDNGKAAEHFARMVADLGGPADLMDTPEKYLAKAAVVKDYFPSKPGRIAGIDARAIGIGIVELGGGRAKPTDGIDHSVGLTNVARAGEEVGQGARPLATIHAKDTDSWQKMAACLDAAITLSESAGTEEQLIRHRIAA